MRIPKIIIEGEKTFSKIESKLAPLKAYRIAHVNWTNHEVYPKVTFKMAHDGENIFLQFSVQENEIRALAKGNNSDVRNDSCVEFFIRFCNDGYYYNLEQSCIGQVLLGYRKDRNDALHAPDPIIDSIKRLPSLGGNNFDLKKGNFEWSLLSVIPVSAFWKDNLSTLDEVKATANFYKCGDKLTQPHYLSWVPVAVEKPNFHRVDFFKELTFEK